MRPKHAQGMYDAMLATEGREFGIEISRTPESVARDGQDRHISEEQFADLMNAIRMWIGTRMIRHHDRTGRGVHNLNVTINVDTAAGPLEVGGEPASVTFTGVIVDGQFRVEAMRG